jgi:hypothetical protein
MIWLSRVVPRASRFKKIISIQLLLKYMQSAYGKSWCVSPSTTLNSTLNSKYIHFLNWLQVSSSKKLFSCTYTQEANWWVLICSHMAHEFNASGQHEKKATYLQYGYKKIRMDLYHQIIIAYITIYYWHLHPPCSIKPRTQTYHYLLLAFASTLLYKTKDTNFSIKPLTAYCRWRTYHY